MSGATTAVGLGLLGLSAAQTIASMEQAGSARRMQKQQLHQAQEIEEQKMQQAQQLADRQLAAQREAQAASMAAANRAAAESKALMDKQLKAQDEAMNRANQKRPNTRGLLEQAQQSGRAGASGTMLTGPQGVDTASLQLGRTTLLGQ